MKARLVIAGNNLAATYVLDLALEMFGSADVLVIAPPRGAHHAWQVSLSDHAERRGVDHLTPSDVNATEVLDHIRAFRPDALLSVYYTQIFREGLLEAVRGPCLNFHPSLLPLHRGAAPLVWAIADGDTVTGLTVHHIDRGIDTGRIVIQHALPIHTRDTGYQLHQKMARLVRGTARDVLNILETNEPIPAGQPQSGRSTYHSSRDPSLNHLDWSNDRERTRNVVRALAWPLPGAFALLHGEPLLLERLEDFHVADSSRPRTPGMVEFAGRDRVPVIWCSNGPLQVIEFRNEGQVVSGEHLVSRRHVDEGMILT